MPEVTKEAFNRLPNVRWRGANGCDFDRRVHLWVALDFAGFPGCEDRYWYEEKPTPHPSGGRTILFEQRDTAIFRGHRVDYHPELRPRFIYHDVADDRSDFDARARAGDA